MVSTQLGEKWVAKDQYSYLHKCLVRKIFSTPATRRKRLRPAGVCLGCVDLLEMEVTRCPYLSLGDAVGPEKLILTPGINFDSSQSVMGQGYGHPTEAIRSGADAVIVGSGIIRSDSVSMQPLSMPMPPWMNMMLELIDISAVVIVFLLLMLIAREIVFRWRVRLRVITRT